MQNVSTRLKNRRTELGLNVSHLAKTAHVPHSVVSRIESGECTYSRHLFEIADALDVNVDWLVRGRMPKKWSQ